MKRTKGVKEEKSYEFDRDFETDKSIDVDNVPGEILNMSNLIDIYSSAIDNAEKILAQTQLNCDIDDAKLENQVRSNPKEFGIEKPTEASIKMAIRMSDEWKESELKKIKAIDELNAAKTAMKAIYTKRHSLDQLLSAGKMNWFAMPEDVDDLEDYNEKYHAKRTKELHYRQKQRLEKLNKRN